MIYPCENLTLEEFGASRIYGDLLTEIGLSNKSFEEIQRQQASITGGISASFILLPDNDKDSNKIGLKISSKSLEKNANAMQDLILETGSNANFKNEKRIKEIIEFNSSIAEKSLTQNGHSLAMSSAASQINTKASSNELISGLTFVKNLKSLKASFSKQENIIKYIDLMEGIQNKIANTPMYSYIASSLDKSQLNIGVPIYNSDIKFTPQTLAPIQEKSIGWITGSQVCFCAEAFPTVGSKHPDAPKLSVLAAVLRNGYLHSAIREKGGAYGAGAAHDAVAQTFQFYSYSCLLYTSDAADE